VDCKRRASFRHHLPRPYGHAGAREAAQAVLWRVERLYAAASDRRGDRGM